MDVVEAFDLSPPRRAARTADAFHLAGSPHGARGVLAGDDRDRIAHARHELSFAMSVIDALEATGALEHADRISRHDVDRIDRTCRTGELGCVDCKTILADHLVETFAPFRARRAELAATPGVVRDVLAAGAERVRPIAQETIATVREAMHLR